MIGAANTATRGAIATAKGLQDKKYNLAIFYLTPGNR
jgi:hypothetical protein